MGLLDLIVLLLAASVVVDVWRNGSIFEQPRAYVEARVGGGGFEVPDAEEAGEPMPGDPYGVTEPQSWCMWAADTFMPDWLCALLDCSYCLSFHTPWLLALLFYFPPLFLTSPWLVWLWKLPVYSLAATRVGNIINACLPASERYDTDD